MLKLIEPTYKEKLGIGMSYPVGTEAISKALEEVPQYDNLSISYRKTEGRTLGVYSPTRSLVRLKQDTRELLGFDEIIAVWYSEPKKTWPITVHRSQSNQSKQIRIFLLNVGLPLIKEWLITKRSETWYNGYRHFSIGLNATIVQYAVRETFNDQLISKYIEQVPAV